MRLAYAIIAVEWFSISRFTKKFRRERIFMLIVRYNGQVHTSCTLCTSPTNLVTGRLYEVHFLKIINGFKLYELAGIEGIYPATWFTRVGESYDTYETHILTKYLNGVFGEDWLTIS